MLYNKTLQLVHTQWTAARPHLQAAVARPTARTGAADSSCGDEVMMVATAMASVFIILTLVHVPHGADRSVAGRETDWPPMASATECCRRTDFSSRRGHR
jgi:hypothetical protein